MPHRMKSCWRYPFRLVSANQAASAPRSSTTSPRSTCGRVLVRSRTGPCMGTTAAISNLLRFGRPQNPLRSEKKNQDQRRKNEGITVGGERVREQGDQENLAKTENVCAQYGPWNRAESPDDSRDEGFQYRNKAHVVFDATDPRSPQERGNPGKRCAEKERGDDYGVDIDPHQPRRHRVLGGRSHRDAGLGSRHEPGKYDHQGDGGQDRYQVDATDLYLPWQEDLTHQWLRSGKRPWL